MHSIMEQQIKTCVKGLMLSKKKLKKKELLDIGNMKIFLQISAIKVAPGAIKETVPIPLPAPYWDEHTDVCLFVKDLRRGIRVDHQQSQRYWRAVLDRAGVTRVTQVMPLRQLKTEYSTFEARRKLCHAYDVFLTDVRIGRLLPSLLGKEFVVRKKRPVEINMDKKGLVGEIDSALGAAYLRIYNKGESSAVQVGRCSQSADQLIANVTAAVHVLDAKFPGGLHNVRSMHVKLEKSVAVPLHASDVSPEQVPVPPTRPMPGRRRVPVRGELSTARADSDVVVDRFGGVRLLQKRPLSSDEELTDEEAFELQSASHRRKQKKTKRPSSKHGQKNKRSVAAPHNDASFVAI